MAKAPVRTADADEDLEAYTTVDAATKSWLHSLHHIWSLWKKSKGVTLTLHEYFQTAPNPYFSNLRILVNTNDFYHVKTRSSLAFTVIEEFSNWITPLKGKYKDCLVPDLKIAAFRLVSKQKNMQLMKMVSDVYEFDKENTYFIGFIKELIENKKFKEAGQFAEIMKLQNEFADPEILLIPLILQNKVSIAEDLLKGHPQMQSTLVTYLDNLLAPNKSLQQTLDKFIINNNIPDVKISTVQHKPMAKLVARLAKLYHLPPEACPFLHKKRGEGALQFLIYKRYVDGSLSIESWREMAKEAIGADPRLQVEILKSLINANDPAEALYFAQTYNVSREDWPWHLTNYANDNPDSVLNTERNDSKNDDSWDLDDNGTYYSLNLPRDHIQIISDSKSFENFLDHGLRNINLVGIDSEWKPSFSIKKPELALIQIATQTHVYILDVTTLGNNVQHLWADLGSILFNNRSILKLGFGIAQDISVIRESLPALSNIRAVTDGYMDLGHLWKKLLEEENFVFPFKGDDSFTNENLSKLVELCLGQRLNKSDQFSNWERRPLRESQIIYASLDAYCLLEIYNALATQCDRLGIPFQDVCNHMHHPTHKPSTGHEEHKSDKNTKKSNKKHDSGRQHQGSRSQVQHSHQNHKPTKSHQYYGPSNGKHHTAKRFPKSPAKAFDMVYSENHNVNSHPQQSFNHNAQHPNRSSQSWPAGNVGGSWTAAQRPAEAGFVCDSMLGGLARQLRKCGLDCVYFDRDRGGDQSFRIALEEKRILLTRNGNFHRFIQYLPHGYCYEVIETKPENQLAEVLAYYKIEVMEANVFSRCQFCNMNEFVYVSKATMATLFQRFGNNFYSHPGPSTGHTNDLKKSSAYNHWDTAEKAMQTFDNELPTQKQLSCRTWQLSYCTLNVTNCTTKYNSKVQIDQVPPNVLQYVNKFYVCEGCGKVYWYGSHMDRALNGSLRKVVA